MKVDEEKLNDAYRKACEEYFVKLVRETNENFWKDPAGNTLKAWKRSNTRREIRMKVEDQVISLEYAKRLTGLGVKHKSLFYWRANYPRNCFELVYIPDEDAAPCLPAYTVAELIPLFPGTVCGSFGRKEAYPHSKMYGVYYSCGDGTSFSDDNGANSLAALLIHLLENKLIDITAA